MSNLLPIPQPDAIAAAIIASTLHVSFARDLVQRINAANAEIERLGQKARLTGNDLSPADEKRWTACESQIETCRGTLQTLIAKVIGVCPEDLVNAL